MVYEYFDFLEFYKIVESKWKNDNEKKRKYKIYARLNPMDKCTI